MAEVSLHFWFVWSANRPLRNDDFPTRKGNQNDFGDK
jgi:hypothetical protein